MSISSYVVLVANFLTACICFLIFIRMRIIRRRIDIVFRKYNRLRFRYFHLSRSVRRISFLLPSREKPYSRPALQYLFLQELIKRDQEFSVNGLSPAPTAPLEFVIKQAKQLVDYFFAEVQDDVQAGKLESDRIALNAVLSRFETVLAKVREYVLSQRRDRDMAILDELVQCLYVNWYSIRDFIEKTDPGTPNRAGTSEMPVT